MTHVRQDQIILNITIMAAKNALVDAMKENTNLNKTLFVIKKKIANILKNLLKVHFNAFYHVLHQSFMTMIRINV